MAMKELKQRAESRWRAGWLEACSRVGWLECYFARTPPRLSRAPVVSHPRPKIPPFSSSQPLITPKNESRRLALARLLDQVCALWLASGLEFLKMRNKVCVTPNGPGCAQAEGLYPLSHACELERSSRCGQGSRDILHMANAQHRARFRALPGQNSAADPRLIGERQPDPDHPR
jgi:hypothetical protein